MSYILDGGGDRFALAALCALAAQFGVEALRSLVRASQWWVSGLKMLVLGVLVAVVAYGTGAAIAAAVQNGV